MRIEGYSMGHCLFQNVLSDLHKIKRAFDEIYNLNELSPEEEKAYFAALKICTEIAEEHA